jgi:acetyl esterase/lipase
MADGEPLVDETGSVYIGKYRHISEFSTHLNQNSTVIYYAFNRKDVREFRKYLLELSRTGQSRLIKSAKLIRLDNNKRGRHKVVDLLSDEPARFGGTCVIKCGAFESRTTIPSVLALPDGSTRIGTIVRHSGIYHHLPTGLPLGYWGAVPEQSHPAPVVALFHGGGWARGSRKQFEPFVQILASHGYACFAFDYRTSESHEATPLEAIEDAYNALSWLRSSDTLLGLDSDRLVIGGGSAGGHLAGSIAHTPLENAHVSRPKFSGLVLFNPVTDTSESGYPPPDASLSTRINILKNMTGPFVPTIVFHGVDDRTVPIENSRQFVDRIRREGGTAELHEYPGASHTFFNWKPLSSNPLFFDVTEKLLRFLEKTLAN